MVTKPYRFLYSFIILLLFLLCSLPAVLAFEDESLINTEDNSLDTPSSDNYDSVTPPAITDTPDISTERIVTNDHELKEALADINITRIYLGNDITLTKDTVSGIGIIIGNKPSIEIIGTSPEENHEIIHTLTEYDAYTTTYSFVIQVPASNNTTTDILLKDINVEGYNYYSPITVNTITNKNVTITYDNVTYHGPQLTYNRSGAIVIRNCRIDIDKTGGANAHEVAEVSYVRLEGINQITHEATGTNHAFWLPYAFGSITIAADSYTECSSNVTMFNCTDSVKPLLIEEGAKLIFTGTPNSNSIYPRFNAGLFNTFEIAENAHCVITNASSATNPVVSSYGNLVLHTGSVLEITTDTNAESLEITAGSIHLQEGSSLIVNAPTKSSSHASVNISKGMTVDNGATFRVFANSGRAALETGGDLTFTTPDSVVLLNNDTRALRYSSTKKLNIEALQLNLWTELPTHSLLALPPLQWLHKDLEIIKLSGTVSLGALGNIGGILSSILPGLLEPLDFSKLNLTTGKLLAFGNLTLDAVVQTEYSKVYLTGITKPGSSLRLTYNYNGEQHKDFTAEADGTYKILLNAEILSSVSASLASSDNYLYINISIGLFSPVLEFASPPDNLNFRTTKAGCGTLHIQRTNPDWTLHIKDTWGLGSTWRLYGTLTEELHPAENSALPSLKNSICFIDRNGIETKLKKDEAVLIYTHDAGLNIQTDIKLKWDAHQGFLLNLDTNQVATNVTYRASIQWKLVNGP